MKVILACGGTGGHIYPAVAIADKIRQHSKNAEILFVGSSRGIENDIVRKAGYDITHIEMYGINRKNPFANIRTAYYFLASRKKAAKLINDFKPDFVIGTGGYQCYPPIYAAAKAGIPSAVHESNSIPGVAVRMVEKYVDRIYTNFPGLEEKLKYKEKVMRVGNPLVSENIIKADEKTRKTLGIPDNTEKIVLSFGGSRGAPAINEYMIKFISEYAPKHKNILFVHATGKNGYEISQNKLKESHIDNLDNVRVLEYIYNMPLWEAAADAVICRAGAMTISEMALGQKACIFIPSPYVAENHQYKNAKLLSDKEAAVLIEEKELSTEKIKENVEKILFDKSESEKMKRNISAFALRGASEKIYKDMQKIISRDLFTLIKREEKEK